MSNITPNKVLIADGYEKEIEGIKAEHAKKKQTFIAWLEKRYTVMSAARPTLYVEGYTDALEEAIDKAKEML